MEGSIAGVILAGGRSSRMGGGDKSLRMLDGRPMLGRVVDRLRPQVARLALNANGDPARFAQFGLVVVADPVAGFRGPLAGMLAGMEWAAAEGFAQVVTVAADTPFLPENLVPRLEQARKERGGRAAVAASDGGLHPVFALLDVGLHGDLRRHLDGGGARVVDWLDGMGAARVTFPPLGIGGRTVDPFFNVNDPDDLETARSIIEEAGR